jgi:hypothetical protein
MAAFETSGVADTPAYKRFERQLTVILILLLGFFLWAAFDGSERVVGFVGAALVAFLLVVKLQMVYKRRRART